MICDKTESCFFELLRTNSEVNCKNKHLCLDFCDRRSDAKCEEKGKVYHLLNSKNRAYKILSIHIDGGVVILDKKTPQNVSKCDYLFLVDTNTKPTAILIELKGCNIIKAVEQIQNTLRLFKDSLAKCEKVYGRIVFAGRTPNIQNIPSFMNLQRELKRKNGNLFASEKISDKIEDLI